MDFKDTKTKTIVLLNIISIIILLILIFVLILINTIFSIIALIVMLLVLFENVLLLTNIIRVYKKYNQQSAYYAKNPNARKETFIDPESFKYDELDISDIKKIDNTIVIRAFNEYFNTIFEIFENGYNKLNADILKKTVNNGFYEDLSIRFSLKKNNKKPTYDIKTNPIKNPAITKIYKDSNNIYIEVYTYINIDRHLKTISKEFKKKVCSRYYKSDELFKVLLVKNINNIDKCPNCNALLDNCDKCSYCGSSINQLANKYKICQVEKMAVLDYIYDKENNKWKPQGSM